MSRRTPLVALGFLLVLVTCRDGMEPRLQLTPLAVAPVLPSEQTLATFGLTLDHVRFIVVRGGLREVGPSTAPDTLVDTTVVLPPDLDALDLNLRVPLVAAAETLQVSIVALAGTIPLFQGTSQVEVLSGAASQPTEIPVLTYVGPGAGIDSLAISPAVPFIYFNDSLRFQVQAFQGGVPVSQFYVSWSTSDSSVARINGTGLLRARASRTTVRVTARTPGGGAADSTIATIVPVPTQLAIISGAGQSGLVGQPLGTPLEVEVRAADNLPIGGVAVRFRGPAGGSPADTTITTGPSGRAVVNAILGSLPGNQIFQVSLPAFPSVVASFTAAATSTTISPAMSIVTVSTGAVLSGNTVKLRLQGKDAAGNNITSGGDVVVFSSSGGSSTGAISATADSGNGVYTAVFTGVLAGTATTIGASVNGNAVSTPLPTISVSPGSVSASGSTVTVSPSTVVAGNVATLRLRAKDAAGNLIPTGGDVVVFGISGASSGAIGITADSGNGVYTATFTGQTAGSASTVTATLNGNPVTSGLPSITVTPAAPAQLAFTVQPTNALVATPITPAVEVTARDAYGNTTPAFTGAVTIAIGTNPSSGLLSGTLAPTAVAGLATFSDLQIDQSGVGYTLTAAANGLASATSVGFDVLVPSGTIAWSNPAGGNWSAATNWAGGVVPGPTNTAVITLPGTYTVTFDVNSTVNGLQLGGSSGTQTLAAASRTLTVTGTTQVNANGALQLRSSTLSGGTFSNAGALLVDGSSTISAAVATTSTSTMQIQGNNSVGHSTLTVANSFTNNGQITLTDIVAAYGATLQLTAGTLTNSNTGTITIQPGSGGAKNISAELANQGTVNVPFDLTLGRANAALTNSGTFNLTGGNLIISQSGAAPSFGNTGTIAIGAGDTVKVTNGVFAYGAGSISGGGVLSLSSLIASIATAVNTGTIPLQLNTITVNGSGTLTNAAGDTLDLGNSAINISVVNQGWMRATGSANHLTSTLTTASGSTLEIRGNNTRGGATLTIDQSWTNAGTILLTDTVGAYGATLTMPAATLTNAAGGSIISRLGGGGARNLNVELDNQGAVTVNAALAINRTSASHTNGGTITLSGANLTVTQGGTTPSWSTTGAISIAPGDTLKVSGGALNYTGGSIGGGGVLWLASASANSSQSLHTSSIGLDLQNSSWNGTGTLTNDASAPLIMGNSTIGTPFDNQGTFVARGSSSKLTGGITTAASTRIRVQGNSNYGGATLQVTTAFTNNGTIELTDSVAAYGAMLTMPVGVTLTNASGGTITSQPGANGTRTLSAQLDNQGSLTIAHDITMNAASASHTSSGAIALAGGNLIVTQSGTTPSFATSGSISIAAGDTLRITSGSFVYNAGTISGGGAVAIVNATATANQNFSTGTNGLDLQNATWGGTGILTVAPSTSLLIGNSTIATPFVNQGFFEARGSSSKLTGSVTTVSGSTMRVQGNNTFGGAVLTVSNGFTNNATIELIDSVAAYGATLKVSSGTLANAGTINVVQGANGSRTLDAELDNQGTLAVQLAANQSFTLQHAGGGAHQNSGTITVSGGDFTVQQTGSSFTNTGAITINTGDTLTISSGTFAHNGGSLTGTGTLVLSSVTSAAFNAAQAVAAILVNSSTVAYATPQSTGSTLLSFTNSTVNGPGLLTNDPGKTLAVRGTTVNAPIDNHGTLLAAGTSALNGTLTTVSGSLLRIQGNGTQGGAGLTIANGFTNNGAIELTDTVSTYGATLNVTAGTLVNAVGATISATTGANGQRNLNAVLDNRGTLTVALGPTGLLSISKASASLQNSGTIDVTGGDLAINQSGTSPSVTNSGSVNIGAGDTITINSGTFSHNSGSFGGGGTLVLSSVNPAAFNVAHTLAAMTLTSSTVTFATDQSTAATKFLVTSSTINGPGILTNDPGQSLALRGTTVNASLVNQGTLLAAGTSAFNGPFTTAAGSLLRIQGNGLQGGAGLTIANGFTNYGGIELVDTVSTYGSTLNVTAGTLVNDTSATIIASSGANGTRALNAELDNHGTLTIALNPGHALQVGKSSATHLNHATINVNGGNFLLSQSGTSPSFTNTGTINLGAGDTLTVTGGALNHTGGTLGGSGTLVLSSVSPATFSVAHTVPEMIVTSSTVNFATPQNTGATGFSFSNSTINGPGTITNDPGKTLGIRGTTVNAPLINLGTLLATATSAFNDTLTTAAGSLLRIQGNGQSGGAGLTVLKGFENAGRVELTDSTSTYGATLNVTNGKLLNLPGAAINVLAGANGARALNAALDNQGAFSVALLPAHTMFMNPPLNALISNTGTLTIGDGSLKIVQTGATPSVTSTGAIAIGAGDTLGVSGGVFAFNGGSLDGPGVLSLSNGIQATIAKPHTLGGVQVTSSTVTFAADQSTGSTDFQMIGSTFNGPGVLTNVAGQTLQLQSVVMNAALVNQGTLVAKGATTLAGAVTTDPASRIRIQGSSGNGSSALSVTTAGGFVNNGALELTDTNATYGATLKVTAGPLVNAATATLDAQLGANGTRTIDAMLDNKGTFTVNRAATLSGTSPAHTNSGVIKVSGGDLTVQPGGANPTFTNVAGGSIDIGVGRTLRFTAGAVSNAASALIDGFGTFDVSAPATFTNDGDFAPGGSPGTLTLKGTVPFSATANYNVEIGGTTPGTQHDQLVVTGSATWAGTLNVTLINGFTPTSGDKYVLATCSVSCINRFGFENLPAVLVGSNISYVGNQVLLTAK